MTLLDFMVLYWPTVGGIGLLLVVMAVTSRGAETSVRHEAEET